MLLEVHLHATDETATKKSTATIGFSFRKDFFLSRRGEAGSVTRARWCVGVAMSECHRVVPFLQCTRCRENRVRGCTRSATFGENLIPFTLNLFLASESAPQKGAGRGGYLEWG